MIRDLERERAQAAETYRWVRDLQRRYGGTPVNSAKSRAAMAAAKRKRGVTPEAEHRERRSRIEWGDMIDNGTVVSSQIAWERGETVIAMREAGLTFEMIGKRLGFGKARAQQIASKAYWRRQMDRRAPVVVSTDRAAVAAAVVLGLGDERRLWRFSQALDALAGARRRDWLNVGSP